MPKRLLYIRKRSRRGRTLTENNLPRIEDTYTPPPPPLSKPYLGQPLLVIRVTADVAILKGGCDLVNLHPLHEDSVPVGLRKE